MVTAIISYSALSIAKDQEMIEKKDLIGEPAFAPLIAGKAAWLKIDMIPKFVALGIFK
jgi:hypothetical protein